MKFAYLIMAHNEPELFGILLEMLDDPRNDVYVHVDKRADISMFRRYGLKSGNLYFIDRIPVCWGGTSQIRCELNLLRAAHSRGGYGYYHLLSGVDLPLKSQDFIHRFFGEHSGKEFVGVTFSDFNLSDLDRKTRYYYFLQNIRFSGKRMRKWHERLSWSLVELQRMCNVRRRYDVPLFKGPNWFSITDNLCGYILSREKRVFRRFRYTLCADEFFLQTEVMNSCFKDSLFDPGDQFDSCMRKIDWNRGSPYVWQDCDYDELVRSDRLFARKFSGRHMGVVSGIREYVLNQGHEGV